MKRPLISLGVVAAIVAAALGAGENASAAGHLTGAGSSLVAPMVENVFDPDFQSKTGNSVTYGSVGSGAGISQISAKTVDFGASDAPLTSAQSGACSGCIEIPWALASTGLSYNLPGVSHLNLSGPVIANIFLGKITNWDDRAIKALNKGVNLPSMTITPVHRSDGSGDTYAFTHYLSAVSPQWKRQVGYATAVNWPTGTGGNGNSGVAAVVSSTAGAIGNNSWFYIRAAKLQAVAIENNAGKFILPYVPNVTAMLSKLPSLSSLTSSNADSIANALSVVNCPYSKPKKGKKPTTLQKEQALAYPMSTFTYVLLRPDDSNIGLLKQFIGFAITSAEEKKGAPLQFAPLPTAVYKADLAAVNAL
jgi:phosphate transport system substrate-binding protein